MFVKISLNRVQNICHSGQKMGKVLVAKIFNRWWDDYTT